MNKYEIILFGTGAALISISFGMFLTAFPVTDPTFSADFFVTELLDDMFDQISHESVIYPGSSATFTYRANGVDIPLVWGMQIVDFQDGDSTRVSISNIFGDDFGTLANDGPVAFDMFVIERDDVYNFEVENTGDRDITVVMMFVEDPENSDALNDPDSQLSNLMLSLAVSGTVLIVGIVVIVVGIIHILLRRVRS